MNNGNGHRNARGKVRGAFLLRGRLIEEGVGHIRLWIVLKPVSQKDNKDENGKRSKAVVTHPRERCNRVDKKYKSFWKVIVDNDTRATMRLKM